MRKIKQVLSAFLATVILCFGTYVPALAQEYNCGAYGVGPYGTNACAEAGTLEKTGIPLLPIIISVLLILAGIYLMMRTRKKSKNKNYKAPDKK